MPWKWCICWLPGFSPPVPAVLAVETGRTWLSAEFPTIPWCTGTGAVGLVALAMDALAVPLTPLAPQPLPALAASRELVAWGVVTVTLDPTVPPGPTGVAQATSRLCITHRINAAVAVVVALGAPGARVARAFARLLVTLAHLAQAGILAVRSPAVVVAGTLARQVITLAVGVTVAFPFAVRAPELGRALCKKTQGHDSHVGGYVRLHIGKSAQIF